MNAVPARLNLTCVGGDDLNVALTAKWADGSPVNLTGATLSQVRDHPTSATVRKSLQVSNGTALGTCTISLDAADTRDLLALGADPLIPTAYYGYWDVQAEEPSTLQTRTIAAGSFNVHIDVARLP